MCSRHVRFFPAGFQDFSILLWKATEMPCCCFWATVLSSALREPCINTLDICSVQARSSHLRRMVQAWRWRCWDPDLEPVLALSRFQGMFCRITPCLPITVTGIQLVADGRCMVKAFLISFAGMTAAWSSSKAFRMAVALAQYLY